MNPIGWIVEWVDNVTGERTVIATTKSGTEATRIARNAGVGESYTVEVSVY